mgnify:CR=1 FL=1
MRKELQIAGFVPFSTVDWPDKLAASVFAQGCPFQCTYCHNFEIIDPRTPGVVQWDTVLEVLDERKGLLDGVVFSGGEALMQAHLGTVGPLGRAMADVRERGFEVGLHAAGSFPNRLEALLNGGLLGWVGLDVKAMPEEYGFVTGRTAAHEKVAESLEALVQHPEVDHEVRLTLWPGILTSLDDGFQDSTERLLDYAVEVAEWSRARGARKFALQRFRTDTVKAEALTVPEVQWSDEEARSRLEPVGFETLVVR